MFRTMGQGTSIDSGDSSNGGTPGGSPSTKPWIPPASRPVQLRIDVPLLLVVVVLLVFGLLMVYSASPDPSLKFLGNPFLIVQRQFIFVLIGVAIASGLTFFNYHFLQRLAVPMLAATIVALIAVLVIGQVSQGAVRTLFGNSVQPSELAKLVIIIYLAVWLYAKRDQIQSVSFGLVPLAVMLGVLGGLIYVQPDLSAVITVIFLGGLMFFLAGGDLKQIAILGMVALVAGWLVIQVSATGSARINSYLVGLNNPMQASDHVKRSIEAFINGGWIGVGIGKGQTKLTGLPVPHTDSIFAVVGEETGILGAVGLLILYSIVLWRGIKIARRAPDELGALLAAGLTLWIAFEAFINMAVMVNLLPFAGNALPLISAGGSNLVVTLIAVGIILNISRLSVQSQENSGRFFSAVVDLRGRNWRRRVSRTDRSAGAEQKS
jgi:cell division protein FtsW